MISINPKIFHVLISNHFAAVPDSWTRPNQGVLDVIDTALIEYLHYAEYWNDVTRSSNQPQHAWSTV